MLGITKKMGVSLGLLIVLTLQGFSFAQGSLDLPGNAFDYCVKKDSEIFDQDSIDFECVLMGAVSLGDIDMVRALHDYGVDVTAPYSDSFLGSPLAHAQNLAAEMAQHGIYGHARVAEFLEALSEE